MQDERPVVLHKGIYKPTATTAEAVFMITGMTIGAGILGIPFVVSRVGILIGVSYIIILGIVMLFLNVMIGEIIARTDESLQLPGLAGKYLGSHAKQLLTITTTFGAVGALLAYIIGEGKVLATLFGGEPVRWSIIFWSIGSAFIVAGLNRIKKAEKILSSTVIVLILLLSLYLLPHFKAPNLSYVDLSAVFLPYGVILFALHGAPAIAEAHALLPRDPGRFQRALIIGTLIPIAVYVLFAVAVAGAQGLLTTEVATAGLGQRFGAGVLVVANIFAVFAMCTGFMGLGTALKETLVWDHGLSNWLGTFLVISVPLLLFLAGFHNFVNILSIVGGLFIGLEAVVMVLVYWQARVTGVLPPSRYGAHYGLLISVPVFIIFGFITMHSIFKLLF